MTDLDASLAEALEAWGDADITTVLHATRWGVDYQKIAYRLRHDTQFALEMRACREWRIPHSQFLEWSEEDQTKTLAYMSHEARRCPRCALHPDDWPDPTEPDYEVAVHTCAGCQEIARWERWARDQSKDSQDALDGVTPYLKRREDDGG